MLDLPPNISVSGAEWGLLLDDADEGAGVF